MAPDPDPYRTLGLASGASEAEIKRAYRRLAKVHHPDAAGEAALPRFLAIQAAYERLVGGLDVSLGGRRSPGSPRRPWEADADRSDATRRAYGGRARGTPPGRSSGAPGGGGAPPGRGPSARPGPSGEPGGPNPSPGSTRGTTGGGAARSGRRRGGPRGTDGANAEGTPRGRSEGARSKATLGSTSYDGADAGPFEPDWGGASWYGTTSGTYWTLNPKEYADPRKHGPEYQARARRTPRGGASGSTAASSGRRAPGRVPDPGPDPTVGPTHTTSSWWDSTAGPPGPAGPGERTDPAGPGDRTEPAGPGDGTEPAAPGAPGPLGASPDLDRAAGGGRSSRSSGSTSRPTTAPRGVPTADPPPLDLGRMASDVGRGLFDDRVGGLSIRVGRAFIAWLPIAIGLGWFAGELTGCGRFAATCDGGADPFVFLLQVAVLAVLLLVPPIASIAAVAAVTALVAAVGAALVLSASGGASESDSRASALGAILLVAWLGGAAIAVFRRVRTLGTPGSPVS